MKMADARKQWLKLLRVGQKNCLILFWEGIFDQKQIGFMPFIESFKFYFLFMNKTWTEYL